MARTTKFYRKNEREVMKRLEDLSLQRTVELDGLKKKMGRANNVSAS